MNNVKYKDEFRKFMETHNNSVDLWVCSYKQEDILSRASRNIKPTKVLAEIKQVPHKNISGTSEVISFTAYKKDGKTLSAKNVSEHGTRRAYDEKEYLYYFLNEKDCNDKYNELLFSIIKEIEKQRGQVIKDMDNKIQNLKESFIGSDYIMEYLSRN